MLIHNSTPKRISLGLKLISSNQADIKIFLRNQFEEFPTARLFCRKSQRLHFCKIAKVYACSSLVALFLKIFDSFFQYFTLRCLLHSYLKGMFGHYFPITKCMILFSYKRFSKASQKPSKPWLWRKI